MCDNSTQLNTFEILVPYLDYQTKSIIKILDRTGMINHRVTESEKELSSSHILKSGLMSDLLTGRVRVPEEIVVAS